MKGEQAFVRDYKGEPLVRRIWAIEESVILIVDDHNYRLSQRGENIPGPIGFHKEDVFKYDPALAVTMKDAYKNGKWDWSKLIPLR